MSGSSLDGLDVCLCKYIYDSTWSFELIKSQLVEFPGALKEELAYAHTLSDYELTQLDIRFGNWISDCLGQFLEKDLPEPMAIGLHGHTVFHVPNQGISLQIGNGSVIATHLNIPVVDTFRSKDVLLGGAGAPLVPVGESLLFPDYHAFVNLGGISNITVIKKPLLAWDVCPCNQVLNYFSAKLGERFDRNGEWAQSGKMIDSWKSTLDAIPYFHQPPPKAISNEWVRTQFIESITGNPRDILHTFVEFIVEQLSETFQQHLHKGDRILFSGGGAFNGYLMRRLQEENEKMNLLIPSPVIVDYKEAIIFGFLGLLRLLNIENVYSTVTGAKRNSVSGIIHNP